MNVLQVTNLLLKRLEHIPADSIWAHRASSQRGSLIRTSEILEAGETVNQEELEQLFKRGFRILEEAAKEKY